MRLDGCEIDEDSHACGHVRTFLYIDVTIYLCDPGSRFGSYESGVTTGGPLKIVRYLISPTPLRSSAIYLLVHPLLDSIVPSCRKEDNLAATLFDNVRSLR